jgi:hypothetical protein
VIHERGQEERKDRAEIRRMIKKAIRTYRRIWPKQKNALESLLSSELCDLIAAHDFDLIDWITENRRDERSPYV